MLVRLNGVHFPIRRSAWWRGSMTSTETAANSSFGLIDIVSKRSKDDVWVEPKWERVLGRSYGVLGLRRSLRCFNTIFGEAAWLGVEIASVIVEVWGKTTTGWIGASTSLVVAGNSGGRISIGSDELLSRGTGGVIELFTRTFWRFVTRETSRHMSNLSAIPASISDASFWAVSYNVSLIMKTSTIKQHLIPSCVKTAFSLLILRD